MSKTKEKAMVRTATELWLELNAKKYVCSACGFTTANRAHFKRHFQTTKHFLMTDFRQGVPRDIRVLVASFLPFTLLTRLGQVGLDAVNMAVGRRVRWLNHRVIRGGDLANPPVRTVYLGVQRDGMLRSLAFVL